MDQLKPDHVETLLGGQVSPMNNIVDVTKISLSLRKFGVKSMRPSRKSKKYNRTQNSSM